LRPETLTERCKLWNLCKGLVVHPCHSPWKCLRALQTRASRETRILGKVYNLCRVKTDISAMLTVKSGLDTHMIIKFKDDLNQCSLFIYLLIYVADYLPLIFYLRVGIYLHLANACLIKT
jgi:hypothetical protein